MGLLVSEADVDDASVVPVVAPIVEVVSDGIKGGLMSKGGAPGGTLPGGKETNLVALTVVVGWRIGARRQRSGGGSDWVEEVSVLVGWGGGGGSDVVALTVVVGWRIGARRQRSGGCSDWVEEVSVLVGWGGGGGSDVVALTVVVGWRIGARRQRSGGDRV
ncbi:hypothetical protein ACLB2K_020418 [Fragaria x ananassa]